jgi:DNA helicase HerA-like ATPase
MLPSPLPLKSSTTNLDLVFAHNTYGETTVPIGLTLEERRRHVYIIGATGTGKTTSLLHMIHHDLLKGSGVGIIDPHGDLIQKLLGVIPEERIKDVVYFNPYDIERPVGLNILELSKGLSDVETQREKDLIASSVISIFQKLYPPRYSGPRMEHILRNTVLTALELEKPTLMTVYRLLTNKEFRKKALTSLPKGILKEGGVKITESLFKTQLDQELQKIRGQVGGPKFEAGKFELAAQILSQIILQDEFSEFITLPAYEYL